MLFITKALVITTESRLKIKRPRNAGAFFFLLIPVLHYIFLTGLYLNSTVPFILFCTKSKRVKLTG